jgi:23S rRNA (cytidine1920-2'-O)/16S rRNA (cytidine1409-2'-O)-methyltransferase
MPKLHPSTIIIRQWRSKVNSGTSESALGEQIPDSQELTAHRIKHYNTPMPKSRLDLLLVEHGLADSRAQAQRLVMAGQVRVGGQVALKPSLSVDISAQLSLEQPPPFVSRGGEKLAAALQAFYVSLQGRACADVGASTGGFTDCLLQHGARRVYAIDVGQGILHWKLRQDARVVVLEKTNARYLDRLPEPVSLVTIDVSFISLKIMLPVVKNWFAPLSHPTFFPPSSGDDSHSLTSITPRPSSSSRKRETSPEERGEQDGLEEKVEGNHLIVLIKPQFEAGRKQVSRGDGVIRDPEIHRQVLLDVLGYAIQEGYSVRGLLRSPLLGPKGNAEFLAWLIYGIPQISTGPVLQSPAGDGISTANLKQLVESVFPVSQT